MSAAARPHCLWIEPDLRRHMWTAPIGKSYFDVLIGLVGCTSVLRVAHKYKGALAEWIVAMKAKKPERVVAVALANKLARICWAILSTGESFRKELYVRA